MKEYFIPMEVTEDTIIDYGIDPSDVVWTKIGNRKVRVLMVPATKEQYYEFMRPLWREDKRKYKLSQLISLDTLQNIYGHEVKSDIDIEADYEKRVLIAKLHKALDELDEIDKNIMTLFSNGSTESEIGKTVGRSQKWVNKRKHKIFDSLKKILNF